MKKWIAAFLSLMMIVSASAALAEYDNLVHFTVCTTQTQAAGDYNSDPLAVYIKEKFNIDYEVLPTAFDSQDEKVRVWINSGTMPTMTTWMTWGYSEYVDYVDQGLLAPLPDGWETDYPNLYKVFEKSEILDRLTIDGQVYAIPHSIFVNFVDMDVITNHNTLFYRKDWAEALGYSFGDTVKLSEFKQYLQDCIDKDMSGTGKTYGLVGTKGYLNSFFMALTGIDYDGFVAEEDQMRWGPTYDKVIDQIKLMREWYQGGLIYPDYYLLSSTEAPERYHVGSCAAIYRDGPVSVHYTISQEFPKNDLDPLASSSVIVTNDDGVIHSEEVTNYWSLTVFNPDNDEETMARVLALTDWLCSPEGQTVCQMGVPGVEWDYDAVGKPAYLPTACDDKGTPISIWDRNNSYRIWRQLGILSDEFNFISPAYDTYLQENTLKLYELKAGGEEIPYNYDYAFFASDTKNIYSVDIEGAVTQMVIGTDDIDTAWQKFIDENKGMWEPLLNELNAEYYNK